MATKHKGWFKRCVKGVKASGSAADPQAVCGAVLKRKRAKNPKPGSAGYDVHIGARKKHFDSHEAARRHALGEQNKGVHSVFVIVDSATGERNEYSRSGKKRNPESAARSMREAFVGAPSKETITLTEHIHVHEHLAALGELVQLKVKTLKGETFTIDFGKAENPKGVGKKVRGWIGRRAKSVAGVVGGIQKAWINPKKINPNGAPILAVTEDGKNLQIVGGNQSLDLKALGMGEFSDKESVIVGSIKTIDYFATKDWKDGKKPETAIYTHRLNEDTGGPLPMLRYDTRNRKCFIDGGLYHIKRPLLGGTSAGIEN